ncbi:aminotransferase class IV [Microlunatus parietis]|uniref:Branched-chain amino acid aminotransferase n=1 Tax=Microlunatus parietis TaxID=682979 RepID=A0A7Y9I279_9ACTN|nr:aminotransferase class IV [Microlunatus parietis]NYE68772.1 branched-chain amino acid aminotransferase [Microlunatus parietis]
MTTTSADPSATAAASGDLRIWVNGTLYDDPSAATIGAADHGLVVGDGVFETLKVLPAGPFTVGRHLDRLTRSARLLGLPDPDHDQAREAIDAVLADRAYELGKIRITYTGGRGPLGSQAPFGPPTLVVAADSIEPLEPTTAIVTAPWTRNERGALAGVKSISYAENVRALAYAAERGGTEAILINNAGHVCEGTGSNIFFVFGDDLVTPTLEAGPLAGITRALVIEWCGVREADLTEVEARAADEVFITSSLRDVQGVHRWDDKEYPTTRSAELAKIFAERSAADLEP